MNTIIIYHIPFAHPCRIQNCKNKLANGRCSLEYREEDVNGNCLLFEHKGVTDNLKKSISKFKEKQ